MYLRLQILFIFSLFLLTGCDNAKVIEAATEEEPSAVESIMNSGNVHGTKTPQAADEKHTVQVNEVLQADRYTYLEVNENGNDFWIAIPKSEIVPGQKLFYEGGLLKKNFKSVEFDRVFETIYLVSRYQPIGNKATDTGLDEAFSKMNESESTQVEVQKMDPVEGVTSLESLMADPGSFEGRVITVQGQVVKLNSQIMGRNWVHIQDGSKKDGKAIDLTITTMEQVLMGAKVIFEGKIALDQDFGAGYRYDIIMEGAVLK